MMSIDNLVDMNADKIRQYVLDQSVPDQACGESAVPVETNPLWQLRGIAKDIFKKAGEWEDIVKQERGQLSE